MAPFFIKSTYYITEKESVNNEQDTYYIVVSDVGNNYTYFFDYTNKEVKAMGKNKDGTIYMVRWYVKAIF